MKRSEKRSLCLPCVTSKRFKLNKVEDDSVENIPFWGPYLAERHWGTVREDLSVDGDWYTYLFIVISDASITINSLYRGHH